MIANLSRRGLLAGTGALVLAVQLPARAQQGAPNLLPHATKISSYLTMNADGTCHIQNPFVEGGQGIDTAVVQILAEEMDASPDCFTISCAPPGADYLLMFGNTQRFTGGSFSVRSSYAHFRKLGATARAMMLAAGAGQLGVPVAELTTRDGHVLHAASGRSLEYAALASRAANMPVPTDAEPKSPADFTIIGQALPRLDVRAKSTGALRYSIDMTVPDMLHAAVVHAPRAGDEPAAVANEAAVRAMPGVNAIHRLPGAMAVTANSFWRARKAVEALEVTWSRTADSVPEAFSNATMRETLKSALTRPGNTAEEEGDVATGLAGAARVLEAEYDAPYLAHGQLEPPNALARFNPDGTLEIWTPNQAPEAFQGVAAGVARMPPERIMIHSRPLGGFFGRNFVYGPGIPMPQAILLAKETGRPVKLIWSREEEFGRDAYRPLSHARFRAGLDAAGNLVALEVKGAGEGPIMRHFPPQALGPRGIDGSVMEGLTGKPYRVANARVTYVPQPHPKGVNVGFWRSVGHSMNDFFFESFLDELAAASGKDPLSFRQALLNHSPRHIALLAALTEMAGNGPWAPFTHADGSRRARGMAMASPFGSHTATMAEASLLDGAVRVHELWIAIDPGSIVNPGIIRQQVEGAAALGLSSALYEEITFENGAPMQRNFDTYTVLRRDAMPKVNVRIVESGAPMGGIGEPGLPGVSPAVANAVFTLTGQRIRALPLSKARLGSA